MYRCFVMLLMFIFAASLITGCGQKQETGKKLMAINAAGSATKDSGTEEESGSEENAPDTKNASNAVTEPAAQPQAQNPITPVEAPAAAAPWHPTML